MSSKKSIFRVAAILLLAKMATIVFMAKETSSAQDFGAPNNWFWPWTDLFLVALLLTSIFYYSVIRPYWSERGRAKRDQLHYKIILNLSPDQIYINKPDSLQFVFMNQAAQTAFGWREEEYLQKTLHDISDGFDEERFRRTVRPLVFGTEKTVVFETVGNNQEPIEITQQVINLGGDDFRFVSIVRDITERKRAETAKTDFISTVSHELRTPLTSIKGALGLMKIDAIKADPKKLDELLDMAVSNADRLGLLVDDILDVEKLSAGMVKLRSDTVNLSSLVNEAVAANEGYASELGVTFCTTGVELPVLVLGDYNRLMQVMANLMSNAAKFSPIGEQVDVFLSLSGPNARISVSDHGAGIPDSARGTIFERFTQVVSSEPRGNRGSGLGLNISKSIIEQHKGSIGFTSKVGEGSTFFFDLPLKSTEKEKFEVVDMALKEVGYSKNKSIK